MDIQQFCNGFSFDAYEYFGAHTYFGGTFFALWAPRAKWVRVVISDFGEFDMKKDSSGIWSVSVAGANAGMYYQYRVTAQDGKNVMKADPFGFSMGLRPDGRSVIAYLPKESDFTDGEWMRRRSKNFDSPLNIYEVHAGSWRKPKQADGTEKADLWYSYEELAELLPAYCKEQGYTHIEFMPLAEHPFDGSWGYQTTGFYAPTSRYGKPEGLAKLINACHAHGIGVILDFVPVHFAVDEYGLRFFDGQALYEYPSNDIGQSEWGSSNFMHSSYGVRSFLQSNAAYWLKVYHADGLRMDAVSRLIYWQGEPARGENKTTLEFLRNMNKGLQERFPTAMLIAEDSTNYPKVTAPVQYNGLGFDYKWDLGWMNDTLNYMQKSPIERKSALDKLTFSMMYNYNEHYVLPFSHDENVHGKATILQKMYGLYGGKFEQARALYTYMMIHPGKKLDFMGNEFGQLREFDEKREQDWDMLKYPTHDAFREFRAALNRIYLEYDAFWDGDMNPSHFEWLDCNNAWLDTCAILRRGSKTVVFAAMNFNSEKVRDYKLKLPKAGRYKLLLDSDWQCWGGRTMKPGLMRAQEHNGTVTLNLAPFSAQIYLVEEEENQPAAKAKA